MEIGRKLFGQGRRVASVLKFVLDVCGCYMFQDAALRDFDFPLRKKIEAMDKPLTTLDSPVIQVAPPAATNLLYLGQVNSPCNCGHERNSEAVFGKERYGTRTTSSELVRFSCSYSEKNSRHCHF